MECRKFHVDTSETSSLEVIRRMILREIEMDLPYQKNNKYIQQIQEIEGVEYKEAIRKDYEVNWKEKRRAFQLMTRCMTSMIERIMLPTHTENCWKIIFECVSTGGDEGYKNLLGVYVIQVPLSVTEFYNSSQMDKKKLVINKILEGLDRVSNQLPFDTNNIKKACAQIQEREYINEWIWNKSLKVNDKIVQVKIQHEVDVVKIYMIMSNKNHTGFEEMLLIDTIPDERKYGVYLGDLKRISEKEVALISKNGEKFIQVLC